MHRAALSGTKRRASTTGRHRTKALKNWLPGHGPSRRGAWRRCGRSLGRWPHRRLIHRPRPSLGHDHARRRSFRSNRCSRTHSNWSLCCGHRRRRRHWWTRRRDRGLGRGRRCWRHNHRTHRRLGNDQSRRRRFRRLGWRCNRGFRDWRFHRGRRFRFNRRSHSAWRRNRRCRSLLTDDGFQHIAGLGDMGEINFGLDFIRLRTAAAHCRLA